MKRSKVIKLLVEYLEGVTGPEDRGTAEDIMYIIEKEAGMLPPPVEKELIRPLTEEACSEFSVYYNTEDIGWEPEND